MEAALPVQPRAIGAGVLSVRSNRANRSSISELRQAGSTKLVFPQQLQAGVETILVNTAGGITGGDTFSLDLRVEQDAELTLTTQAAERAYRAQRGEVGQVDTHITVGAGAMMNWLPQELILFEHSALQRRLSITMEKDAQLLMVEPVIFGRAAMSETLTDITFKDRISITRAGMPIYVDGIRLEGDATAHLSRPAIANGAGAMASIVYVAPDASAQLNAVRAALPQTAGASLLAPDLLVVRHLAPDSFELRRDLIPVLELLHKNSLPTSWRL